MLHCDLLESKTAVASEGTPLTARTLKSKFTQVTQIAPVEIARPDRPYRFDMVIVRRSTISPEFGRLTNRSKRNRSSPAIDTVPQIS